MQINIKNKRILVTGSSSGIGKGILHSFNQHGALTVANSRNKDSLDESVKSYKNCFTCIYIVIKYLDKKILNSL